jgi:hypothetical protein
MASIIKFSPRLERVAKRALVQWFTDDWRKWNCGSSVLEAVLSIAQG